MWTRPLGMLENAMFSFYLDNKEIAAAHSVTINSSSSIDEDTFRKAFEHLRRKTPNLRLVIRLRDGAPWFYEVDLDVNIKMIEEGNSGAEYKKILDTKYNLETGPAWSVIIVPEDVSIPSSDFSIRKNYPFQYCINFGITHLLSDGYSTTTICAELVKILDDVVNGTQVDDKQQIGIHLMGNEFEQSYIEAAKDLSEVKANGKSIRQCFVPDQAISLLTKYYPPKEPWNATTGFIGDSLSVEQTENFIKLCKKHKVKVNSGITAVIDLITHEITKLKGAITSEHIFNSHMVNMRRYCDECSLKTLGLQVGMMFNGYDKSNLDDLSEFWLHAEKVDKLCHEKLDSKVPFKFFALFYMDLDDKEIHETLKILLLNSFLTSNMGNIDSYFYDEAKHVKVTDYVRSTSLDSSTHLLVNYHTLNGRLLYSCNYQPPCSKELARDIISRIGQAFNRIIHYK